MLHVADFATVWNDALDWPAWLALASREQTDGAWRERHARLELDADQKRLASGFTRRMHVLCMTGHWCGDCALQGAAMQRIAETSDPVHVRFLDRNESPEIQVKVPINAGFRVPVTFLLDEDFLPLARMGDRTLSRYRSMARKALADQTGVIADPPEDPVRTVLGEVLAEFERVQLMLRLSPRLRDRHGD